MTKAIIFDLWNTLAYQEGSRINPLVQLMRKFDLKGKISYKDIERGFMTRKFGSVAEACKHLCEYLGIEPDSRNIGIMLDIWEFSQTSFALFPDGVPVLTGLREKYKTALISNTDCFSVKLFFDEGLRKLFDVHAFSCEVGVLKPNPRIFQSVLEQLGIKPREAVMVGVNLRDDVLAAEKLGVKGVLIKRNFDYQPSWVEKGTHERTIKNLEELKDYL